MSAFDRIAHNIAAGGDKARTIMLGFGRGCDGLTAMALFCAAEGYSRAGAATAIGATPEALDTALEELTAAISAERRRRAQERAA